MSRDSAVITFPMHDSSLTNSSNDRSDITRDRSPIDTDDRRSDRCISRTCELHYREAYTTTDSGNDGVEWNKVSDIDNISTTDVREDYISNP